MKQTTVANLGNYIFFSDGTVKNITSGETSKPNSKGKITLKNDSGENQTVDISALTKDLNAGWIDIPVSENTEPVLLTQEEVNLLDGEELSELSPEQLAATPLTPAQSALIDAYNAEQAEIEKIKMSITATKEKNDKAYSILETAFNAAKKVRENETGEESMELLAENRNAFIAAKKAMENFKPEINEYADTIKKQFEEAEKTVARLKNLYKLATGKRANAVSSGSRSENEKSDYSLLSKEVRRNLTLAIIAEMEKGTSLADAITAVSKSTLEGASTLSTAPKSTFVNIIYSIKWYGEKFVAQKGNGLKDQTIAAGLAERPVTVAAYNLVFPLKD